MSKMALLAFKLIKGCCWEIILNFFAAVFTIFTVNGFGAAISDLKTSEIWQCTKLHFTIIVDYRGTTENISQCIVSLKWNHNIKDSLTSAKSTTTLPLKLHVIAPVVTLSLATFGDMTHTGLLLIVGKTFLDELLPSSLAAAYGLIDISKVYWTLPLKLNGTATAIILALVTLGIGSIDHAG